MYTYLVTFVQFDFSIGAAAAWLMLLMSMVLCVFFHPRDSSTEAL